MKQKITFSSHNSSALPKLFLQIICEVAFVLCALFWMSFYGSLQVPELHIVWEVPALIPWDEMALPSSLR